MTMMNDWILAGCAFGIKAFSAVMVFGVLCVALIGVLGLIASIIKFTGDENDGIHRR